MQRIQAEDEPDEVRLRSNIREISWLFGESTRHECRPSKSSARYARANLSERVEVIFRKSFIDLSACSWPIFKLLKGIASIDRVTDVIQWVESIKVAEDKVARCNQEEEHLWKRQTKIK